MVAGELFGFGLGSCTESATGCRVAGSCLQTFILLHGDDCLLLSMVTSDSIIIVRKNIKHVSPRLHSILVSFMWFGQVMFGIYGFLRDRCCQD